MLKGHDGYDFPQEYFNFDQYWHFQPLPCSVQWPWRIWRWQVRFLNILLLIFSYIGRFDSYKCYFSYFHLLAGLISINVTSHIYNFHISELFDKLDVSLFLAYILLHVFYKCYCLYGRISLTCGRLTFSPIWSFKDTCDAKINLSTSISTDSMSYVTVFVFSSFIQ